MGESAEKKIPKGRKKGGTRGTVPFADRPRPFPLSTKRSDFFFSIFRIKISQFFRGFFFGGGWLEGHLSPWKMLKTWCQSEFDRMAGGPYLYFGVILQFRAPGWRCSGPINLKKYLPRFKKKKKIWFICRITKRIFLGWLFFRPWNICRENALFCKKKPGWKIRIFDISTTCWDESKWLFQEIWPHIWSPFENLFPASYQSSKMTKK